MISRNFKFVQHKYLRFHGKKSIRSWFLQMIFDVLTEKSIWSCFFKWFSMFSRKNRSGAVRTNDFRCFHEKNQTLAKFFGDLTKNPLLAKSVSVFTGFYNILESSGTFISLLFVSQKNFRAILVYILCFHVIFKDLTDFSFSSALFLFWSEPELCKSLITQPFDGKSNQTFGQRDRGHMHKFVKGTQGDTCTNFKGTHTHSIRGHMHN